MELKIGKKFIGEGHPTFIVAEISGNHSGSIYKALELIEAAKFAGADAVKLQTYTADTITINTNKKDFLLDQDSPWSEFNTLWDLYNKAHTPWDWHETLFKKAHELDLEAFSSPFDETAVDFLESLNVPAYKIASPEINHIPLIKKIAQTKKPVILSTGVSNLKDLDLSISALKGGGLDQIIVLKCNSTYPAPPDEANLRTIPDIQNQYGVLTGLSDHTTGSLSAIASVALGASLIEKHIKLDEHGDSVDSFFSCGARDFRIMVDQIREVESQLGEINYSITESAKQSIKGKRSIYVSNFINEGDEINETNIKIVRPSFGLHPKYFEQCIGKKALRDLAPGDRLTKELVEW